ncbi:MAG: PDZ domain-containing protein [Verrucomicrobia bacterium]|nr:PDZ domain-containing protein [Verrucomicrobiota bacterium]
MACLAIDGQVVRHQPSLADLLEKFVCVRVVQANGIDLSLCQFDYDLTWAVLFLNADRTIYGRYGTRASRELAKEISVEGFRKAMEGALDLHKNYPAIKETLAGKTGPAPQVKVPEAYPMLRKVGYTATVSSRNPAGGNPGACIHCHQINNNVYRSYRGVSTPIPDHVLWAYPPPNVLGLELDVNERATVKAVAPGSPAAKDGFKAGDQILTLGGQAILSIADVQWVLHQSKKEPDQLNAGVKRSGVLESLTLHLAKGWRKQGDFSWRACNGIISLLPEGSHDLTADEKKKLGLSPDAIAIQVLWNGRGFQKNDVIVEVDGQRNGMTTSDFIAYTVQKKKPKEKIALAVLRAGQEHTMQVEVREAPIE